MSLVCQWLSSPGRVGAAYLGYRWLLATLVTFGLLQSLYQNTAYFLEHGETENVFKYFIYLTNNGRWVQRVQRVTLPRPCPGWWPPWPSRWTRCW